MAGALKVWDGATWQTVAYGAAGNALPAGGATNMLLAKQSAADSDAAWTTAPVVGSITVGTASITTIGSSVTFGEGMNIAFGTTTGTKFGTAITQKMSWWNATPVAQNTGWTATAGYTALKSFNPQTMTFGELARVVGTLVDTLKTYGLLG